VEKPDLPTRDILLQTTPSFAGRVERIVLPSETHSDKRTGGSSLPFELCDKY
jgi:hypothetical protein